MSETFVMRADRIETLDPAVGIVDALAVRDGVVVAVGNEARDLQTSTNTVDLGRFAMPGFIDAHNHHAIAGQVDLFEFQVSPTASVEEILEALKDYVESHPQEAGWVVGGSWGSGLFEALAVPGVQDRFDTVTRGRPLMLRDDSKHNRYANSEALRRAGIDGSTPDPVGGQIVKKDGKPTGVLLEAAGIAIERALARDEPEWANRLSASSKRAIEMLHSHGITSFQDAGASKQLLHALKDLDDAGELDAWVVTSMLANDFIFGTDPLGEEIIAHRESTRSKHHRPDFIKIFLDGVPPSRTGAFLEPYLPDACGHSSCGEPTMSMSELTGWMRSAALRGIGTKVHCTGDASVHMVLDAAQKLRREGVEGTWHVAHGQFVAEADIRRFAKTGVIAEISPALWFPGVITEAIATVLPAERASRMQPNRSLVDAGALVVGGSDWPVAETPEVFGAIYGLVTRADPQGRTPGTMWPEQALTREEAVRAYTSNSARALNIDDVTGTLTPGKSADLLTLDKDLFAVDVEEIPGLQVASTYFAGRPVYAKAVATV